MHLTRKPRRGRHRKPRTRFPLRHLAAVTLAAVVVAIPSTANGDTGHLPKSAGVAEKVELPPAPYHDGNPWPTDDPVLCLVDQTGGFPVEQAAAEFDGIVEMTVSDECHEDWYRVDVVTMIDQGMSHAGWFSVTRDDDDNYASGLIQLNLAEAYRMSPSRWRLLIVHELGHAAGLGHTQEVESVMQPDADSYAAGGLSESDREQLEQIYGGAR